MSPDFDFWEHDTGSEDYSTDQKKDCIHRMILVSSTLGIQGYVCSHPLKNGEICNKSECTLKEVL